MLRVPTRCPFERFILFASVVSNQRKRHFGANCRLTLPI
jgi:hypothetical protein